MQHSSKQLQKWWCGDTVEGYPEPALQQKTDERENAFSMGSFEQDYHDDNDDDDAEDDKLIAMWCQ